MTARHHLSRRTLLAALGTTTAATAVTATGWALNRYVVDHAEITDVAAYEAARTTANTAATTTSQWTLTDTTYASATTTATLASHTTGSGEDTLTWYTIDLTLTDATALRSAFADNEYGTNITAKPSAIASSVNAALAINGDYYGFREDGILIRNGVIYRDTGARDGFVLYTDGRAEVYDETSTSAQDLLDAGAWQTLSFGPALIKDGTILDGIDDVEVDTNFGNHSIQGNQPRTAIGWKDTGQLVLMVVDGRDTGYSRGATLPELAQLLLDAGCQCAYNLDGGGSSAMYMNGAIVNQPSNGSERATSDILYVAQGA